jgi:hypothetical protein
MWQGIGSLEPLNLKGFRCGNSTASTQLVHKMSALALKKIGKRSDALKKLSGLMALEIPRNLCLTGDRRHPLTEPRSACTLRNSKSAVE